MDIFDLMKKILSILVVCFSILSSHAQDNYHQELIEAFKEENNLDTPGFIFNNTENSNLADMYIYGNSTAVTSDVEGFDFTKQTLINVPSAGTNGWDSGYGIKNNASIANDDILVFTFWARKLSSSSEVQFFVEDGSSFEKEFFQTLSFTPDWNQYFIAVQASKNYSGDQMAVGFHLASITQQFDIAGLTGFNFGKIDIESVPSSFSTGAYEGIEADAAWRTSAADRIESLRKADLTVIVKDLSGNLLSDADIKVEMLEHEFKFGSALVGCRTPGSSCFDATYVAKLNDLDGNGHTFNAGVTENEMKWDGWEEEWFGPPSQTEDAVQYFSENGIKMRGHTLIWPGYTNLPDDIAQNQDNLDYLRTRIAQRIDEMINNPELSPYVREWDILNEITQNRDLEEAFKADPNFTTGREIYQEIIRDVRAADPDLLLYINDYVVLSGGGSSSSVVTRYKEYLDELHNSDAKFDGIGFQGHIGSNPTSILKVKAVFDEFYERYGVRQSVTEYDISDLVDPEIAAQYLADFMTMTFSHPSMDAFLMWGFWDGNHWKQNAPMFDLNWNLKPSGQAFIDKVFGEWWTEESVLSNSEGIGSLRAFKGKHKVTVTKGEATMEMEIDLAEDQTFEFTLDVSSGVEELLESEVLLQPSLISDGYFSIESGEDFQALDLDIFDVSAKRVFSQNNVQLGEKVNIDLNPGLYIVNIQTELGFLTRKIVVE